MLKLYHMPGAICAQKVRLALAEKRVAWESAVVAGPGLRSADYLRLNPNGVVPTLLHDDQVLLESRIISEYIEERFDGPPLMPSDAQERHRVRFWSKQIDDSLHLNVYVLSFVVNFRDMYLAMPPEQHAVALPGLRDPVKRDRTRSLLVDGFDSPFVGTAYARFERLAEEMETALAASTFLASNTYSLADADFTAYLHRLEDLGLSNLWRDKPCLSVWFQNAKGRDSYGKAIADWETTEERSAVSANARRAAPRFADLATRPATAASLP